MPPRIIIFNAKIRGVQRKKQNNEESIIIKINKLLTLKISSNTALLF